MLQELCEPSGYLSLIQPFPDDHPVQCTWGTDIVWFKIGLPRASNSVHITVGRACALLTLVSLWWRTGKLKRIFLPLNTQHISSPQQSWEGCGILDPRFSLDWKIMLEMKYYEHVVLSRWCSKEEKAFVPRLCQYFSHLLWRCPHLPPHSSALLPASVEPLFFLLPARDTDFCSSSRFKKSTVLSQRRFNYRLGLFCFF